MTYTKDQIEAAVKSKNYEWFDSTDYNVNIVGIRNSQSKDVTNVFDDSITITFMVSGVWNSYCWSATTDPGKKSILENTNPKGVARLVPNQYLKSHIIGLHKGKYEALVQANAVTVYRDNNKDMVYDENKTETGLFGINIHHAGVDSTIVENWSAGCTVFKKLDDFNQFMEICKKASSIHGNHFTYTLIESKDII